MGGGGEGQNLDSREEEKRITFQGRSNCYLKQVSGSLPSFTNHYGEKCGNWPSHLLHYPFGGATP